MPENALANAASPYLRSASHQPVDWHEWSPEAFAKAQREDKPILLAIGAVWCHWCHVMDRESYTNEGTAALINELFIPVRVDRDERPDVDARYQSAIAAISGQGGWPLTAFLTPDGRPYFGGGYFPPADRYGRPGLERICVMLHEAWTQRREEVLETAESVMESIAGNERFADARAPLSADLANRILAGILPQLDTKNGGFGQQPKFPNSTALDLLIATAADPLHQSRGETSASSASFASLSAQSAEAARLTLTKMAQGGIHDHLAGGFHRYSTDEHWIVPHFEKTLYDNAALLANFAHAYAVFDDPLFAATAQGIVRFFTQVLSDQTNGGFYNAQAADAALDDDGDYFTWTRAEAQAVLTPEEFAVIEQHFNLRPVGDMRHHPAKNVLHQGADRTTIARNLKLEDSAVTTLITSASAKLYAARLQRPTPTVDRTLYTGWNAMAISAYFAATGSSSLFAVQHPEGAQRAEGRGICTSDKERQAIQAFALKSLDRLLLSAWHPEQGLAHVIAYPEGHTTVRIPANLDDYAFTTIACLDAFASTADPRYLTSAQAIADGMLTRFYDKAGGAFFDIEPNPNALGALTISRKPLQDSPTPSGNSMAAIALARLATLTPDGARYATAARQTLETFAAVAEHFGLYAASYALAVGKVVKG